METITDFFASAGIQFDSFWKLALIILAGVLILFVFGRFVFGKHSILHNAVSSVIGILFIYGLTVILESAGAKFSTYVAPLPFVTISGDKLLLFSFKSAHYTTLCTEVLSMIILSFLVNIADRWIPTGKKVLSWIFFRCLTVIIGYLMHLIVVWLFNTYLPEGLVTYAPTVLLAILGLLLVTGILKPLVGGLLATFNPIIGGLYTFFFSTIIGKQVTKAILTTGILAGIILLLQNFGITSIAIASAALAAYLPVVIILIVIWFIIGKVFG